MGRYAVVKQTRFVYVRSDYVMHHSTKALRHKLDTIIPGFKQDHPINPDVKTGVLEPEDAIRYFVMKLNKWDRETAEKAWSSLLRVCEACPRYGLTLEKCGGCHKAYYCSFECQKAHWYAQHKYECLE
jgi:hypothetical protein